MSRLRSSVLMVIVTGLFLGGANQTCQAQYPELRRLRALLVIDTNSNLQKSVQVDMKSMVLVLRNGIPLGRLDLTILQGNNATPANILNYYRNLNTNSSESVFFYFAGHGGTDPERGHFLSLHSGNLYRWQLRQTIQQKNPGLAVILTDCCSTFVPSPSPARVMGARKPLELQFLWRCLFFQHRGIVDITAASLGKPAIGNDVNGGYFTSSLKRLFSKPYKDLDRDGVGFMTWQTFFADLRWETQNTFRINHPGLAQQGHLQDPFAFELADAGNLNWLTRRSYSGAQAQQALKLSNEYKGYIPWVTFRENGWTWCLFKKAQTRTSSLDPNRNQHVTITVGREFVWQRYSR